MSILYSILIRRCLSNEIQQSLFKLCFCLLLTVLTTFLTNNLFSGSDTFHSQLQQMYINNQSKDTNIYRQETTLALHLALRLIEERKFDKARRIFEHTLNLDPSNSELLIEYGQFLEHYQKDLIRAEHFYTRALVKQPSNHRALEFQKRTRPIVEQIDQTYFSLIDELLKEFYRISDINPYIRRAKRESYYRHIYHSNAIEGNTLTLRETRFIIETRLAVQGKSLVEQQEVLGLDQALQYVNCSLVNRLGPLTRQDIIEIHRRILGFVNPIEAGEFRRHQVYVGSFIPPSSEQISDYIDDLIRWLNTDEYIEDLHAIELAALVHYKFVYIHPFLDGNGRTGRLLMNLILMRLGYPPVIIKKSERFIYYSYLTQANGGDIRPLIRFIGKCMERTLNEFLSSMIINGRDDDEDDDYRVIQIE